jgi:AcrR family transcriptional regulator
MAGMNIESSLLTPKGRETRERIISAAAELIYERSVGDVSLDDIRHAVGVSKSQLYHYFNDKSDLLRAVIEYQRGGVLEFHRGVLESLSNIEELELWRDMVVAAQTSRECRGGCPLGSLVNELSELDGDARAQLADAFDGWEKLIADGLTRMIDSGALRPDASASNLALSVMASLQGGLLLAELARQSHPLEVALDTALAYVRSFAPGSWSA